LPASNRFFLRFFTKLPLKMSFLTPSIDTSTECCGPEIELHRSLFGWKRASDFQTCSRRTDKGE
jgi:hypothetical protein